jgi:hypothetical protein
VHGACRFRHVGVGDVKGGVFGGARNLANCLRGTDGSKGLCGLKGFDSYLEIRLIE